MKGYSNQDNISIVVDLMKQNGIHKVVISPGGTNIAFVKAVQDDPFFECYSIVDERSAIYFAIGLYLSSGETIAASCTSAQATRNYIPGLTEAYYKRVPILAITMEKHRRFIGQEYMQAPDQCSLPSDAVKKSFELPFITDDNDELLSIRMVNEAILELTDGRKGPVQLCIPWLDFPLTPASYKPRTIRKYTAKDVAGIDLGVRRILIVCGESRPYSADQLHSISRFADRFNCAVYVNHLSNYYGQYAIEGNLLFLTMQTAEFVSSFAPDIIISIGGQTGDYPLYRKLSVSELSGTEHWRVATDGEIIDTYDKLTAMFNCGLQEFFDAVVLGADKGHEYYHALSKRASGLKVDMDLPFSNAYLAQRLCKEIPDRSTMQFSILNSLRVWSLFPIHADVRCFSNVGAFGIDGGMSTLLGQSVLSDGLHYIVIGDLAFYYDMNSLGIRHIGNNVRILLINNNGGVEFKMNYDDSRSIDRYIAAADHFKNAEGWAQTCGFQYFSAKNKEEFETNWSVLVDPADRSVVFEVFVSDKDEYEAYTCIIDANSPLDVKKYVKRGLKRFLRE